MGVWSWLRGSRGAARPVAAPTPSPVGWISDAVWTSWMQGDGDVRPMVEKPRVFAATADDRRRAPVAPPLDSGWAPEPGPLEALAERLRQTPPGPTRGTELPVWPLCCERLATLISNEGRGLGLLEIEEVTGPLDLAFLEGEIRSGEWGEDPAQVEAGLREGYGPQLAPIRRGKRGEDGLNVFQCRACRRVYVGSCHP